MAYNVEKIGPLKRSVDFSWKFVSDLDYDNEYSVYKRSNNWFKDLDECVANALSTHIDQNRIDSSLIIEVKIDGDWKTLTNNELRQTLNVYTARRLFYDTWVQQRRFKPY